MKANFPALISPLVGCSAGTTKYSLLESLPRKAVRTL